MKKILLISILFTIINLQADAQIYKFRSYAISTSEIYEDGTWGEWTEWVKSNVLIVVNSDKDNCTIYADETYVLELIEYIGDSKDHNGNEFSEWKYLDPFGSECILRLTTIGDIIQICLFSDDITIKYEVSILK